MKKLLTGLGWLIASFALAHHEAHEAVVEIDGATTGWLMVSTAFVFLMVIGLAFFVGVRSVSRSRRQSPGMTRPAAPAQHPELPGRSLIARAKP